MEDCQKYLLMAHSELWVLFLWHHLTFSSFYLPSHMSCYILEGCVRLFIERVKNTSYFGLNNLSLSGWQQDLEPKFVPFVAVAEDELAASVVADRRLERISYNTL